MQIVNLLSQQHLHCDDAVLICNFHFSSIFNLQFPNLVCDWTRPTTALASGVYSQQHRLKSVLLQLLARFDCFFDRADHKERLLRQIVVFAFDNFFEAFDRIL